MIRKRSDFEDARDFSEETDEEEVEKEYLRKVRENIISINIDSV